jgi:hypothetical protein
MKIEEIVAFCERKELQFRVGYDVMDIGGHVEKEVDLTSYRSDQSKPVIADVWYSKYRIVFNPSSREVVDFGKGQFDIRNDPEWDM